MCAYTVYTICCSHRSCFCFVLLGIETTLLHLSAHLGFSQFASFLMEHPGASQALEIQDKNGKLPLDIAKDKGLEILVDVFVR